MRVCGALVGSADSLRRPVLLPARLLPTPSCCPCAPTPLPQNQQPGVGADLAGLLQQPAAAANGGGGGAAAAAAAPLDDAGDDLYNPEDF